MSLRAGDGAPSHDVLLDQEHVHAQFASDVAFTTDAAGILVWASAASLRILGWTSDELQGRRLRDLIHPDDASMAAVWRRELIGDDGSGAGGTADPLRLVRADGTDIWCRVSASPVRGADGRLLALAGTIHEVGDLVEARREIADAHGLLRRIIDGQVDPHVLFRAVRDSDGAVTDLLYEDVNTAAAAFEGIARDELEGSTLRSVYRSTEEADADIGDCARVLESGVPFVATDVVTIGYRDEEGRPRVADISIVPVDGDRVSYSWRDVTERHAFQQRLAESEERFRLLAENMSDVVVLVQDGVVTWISPSVTRVTGHSALWVIGRDPLSLLHPDDVAAAQQAWIDLPTGAVPRQRFRARSADGSYHWVDAEASVVPGSEGRSVVLALRTVDAEVAALSALQIQARHDELTGLVNRHEVFEHISRSLSGETRSGTRLAMVFCDLDGFKAVNDDHGHAVGDELLRQLAARLQATVRSGDIVARIGGDEFLIVLNGVQDLDNAIALADKLRQQVAMPVAIPGGVISVGASVGVTLAERGESVDAIVARADDAMYLAKRRGKDAVVAIPGPEVTPGR